MSSPAASSTLFSTRGTLAPMLWLALPVLIEQTLNMLVGFADRWIAGRFLPGDENQAALTLINYSLWTLPHSFAFVGIGALAMTARFTGAGQPRQACRIANQAFVAGGFLAAVITVVWAFGIPYFVWLMGPSEAAAPLATGYLMLMVPVIPFIMVQEIGISCFRGAGDTLSGLFVKGVVNVVNVIVSYALVVGWGPLPACGFYGLAYGTMAAHVVAGLIVLAMLFAGRAGITFRARWLRPRWDLIRRILRIGLPGGTDIAALLTCHMIYLAIVNQLGEIATAAHGVAISIEALAYMPGSAFQVAAATMAGQYLGMRDHRRAGRSVLLAVACAMSMMTVAGIGFYFGGLQLAAIFLKSTSDPTAMLTAQLLQIVALGMPGLAIGMVLAGALRGAGDTRFPLMITLAGFVGVRLPLACLMAWSEVPLPLVGITLPGLDWGVAGAWYAMVIDIYVRAALVSWRFWHGGWKWTKI